MAKSPERIAVFPGAFDPLSYGHLDIIRRGARLFDRLIVGVGRNPEKQLIFTAEERVEMIRQQIHDLPNVEVRTYEGLTIEFVQLIGAHVVIRGIRDTVDLRTELQTASANLIVGDIETVFLLTTDQHALTSSTLIRQIVELSDQDHSGINRLVPAEVLAKLRQKLHKR